MYFFKSPGEGLTAAEISELYLVSKEEKSLAWVAYDISADRLTEDVFSQVVKNAAFFAGVYEDGRPLGFLFLSAFEGDTARLHFCLLNSGKEHRHEIGRLALKECFERFGLQGIVSIAPVINQGACKYALELGGFRMGVIPGICQMARLEKSIDGVQFLFVREDYI